MSDAGPSPDAPRIRLVSCLGTGTDLGFLPHFLRHYAGLGIAPDAMHLVVHSEDTMSAELAEAERILAAFGAAAPRRWIAPYTSDAMWEERRALQRRVAVPGDWIVNADIDEHYVFPAPLAEVIAECRDVGADCVQGLHIDRLAPEGRLAPVASEPALAEQFPVEGEASFRIFGAGRHHGISATTKLMLHAASVLPRRGGHNPEGLTPDSAGAASRDGPRFLAGRPLHTVRAIADPAFRFAFPFLSAHYKWTASRMPSLATRLATPGVSPAGLEYGGKVRDYLATHGRIRLGDVALRGPAERPDPDWRGRMARMRAEAAPRPATFAARAEVAVVIRAAGERTEAAARELALAEVPEDMVAVLHETPFALAVQKAFEQGVALGAEWTLCLDADVLLRPGAVADLLAEARRHDPALFGISGRVADPLLGQIRFAGQHLYRTALLPRALETAEFDPAKRRPESHVKRQMRQAGHGWMQTDVMTGLHDAEQSFADIFRKVVVHSRKHERFVPYLREYWTRAGTEAPDLRLALEALEAPDRIAPVPTRPGAREAESIAIDRRLFPERIDAFLATIGLTEKPPLAPDAIAPEEVARRLARFGEAPEWQAARPAIEAQWGPQNAAGPIGGPAPGDRPSGLVRLVSCIGVEGEAGGDLPLLPHFLDHYAGLGIAPARMHLILNAREEESPGLVRARALLAERGLPEPEIWIGPYTSSGMWDRRRALQSRLAAPEDWIVSADADEFHDYPAPLDEVTAFCAERRVACVQGPFVDRVAADGGLPPVRPDRPIGAQFPVRADIGIALGKRPGVDDATGTVKTMLHRGDVLPGLGGHQPQGIGPGKFLYGLPLMHFPRIKSTEWRETLPFRVDHYKWTADLAARLDRRRKTSGASPAGSLYGGRIVEYLERNDGRIDLGDVNLMTGETCGEGSWRDRVLAIAATGAALQPVRARAARRRAAERRQSDTIAPEWRLRQLTFGSGTGLFHAHSYYDIPVLDAGETRIAAYRARFAERWMTPEDAVEIGIVDIANGGFARLGTSRAWSWQQGPMAQWLPDGRLVWNDREAGGAEGDAFVARLHDPETGLTRTLRRPVYAVDPEGETALSVNMARLDRARPGYGYVGGADARPGDRAPGDDGVWRIGLGAAAEDRLILPLDRAAAFLAEHLPEPERAEHREGAYAYWFNHVKIAPGGKRFTVKLRWRRAGLTGPWTGKMGVSLTCGMDGRDLAFLARGTSHVMWLDDTRLYFWHQDRGAFAAIRDAVPKASEPHDPLKGLITANVHIRHVPDDPRRAIYDTPYAEEIDLVELDRATGETQRLARFTGHLPKHGPFRCDLHPVPARDGSRIVVTSLQDGGRQVYVLERKDAA
ncbi:hypothetical protein LX81_02931 [Palleronia aestuarii]|uniref:Glycosyl transferase family 2 n=1 Tax=Palleronia aestuarii TaxID=568105 RepID=A0A2W7N2K9_9RHOB|nr:hypothetical protein [Palleronia aestuarii]PZX14348.1 hypothetical protein LX81_02931 [Palleronia aestuarii]